MLVSGAKQPLRGTVTVPGDKSISHRVVMLGAIADGVTVATGFLPSEDALSTIRCFRQMGVEIEQQDTQVRIAGVGLHGLKAPLADLDAGNSGTTMRLLAGLLSGQVFGVTITGDASLCKRPMRRVADPLKKMGADIHLQENGCAPLHICPVAKLHGLAYDMPVASAQVKSALLLAGLYADEPVLVRETVPSRDHSETMLRAFGAALTVEQGVIRLVPGQRLTGRTLTVPGDISSAAFVLAAAAMVPGSDVTVQNVGVNPTRTGILDVLSAMGAKITLTNHRIECGEARADIRLEQRPLTGVTIGGGLIPRLVDELPVLAFVAAVAEGKTVIADAGELRVKESDRLKMIAQGLAAFGATFEEQPDGIVICGKPGLLAAPVQTMDPAGDHRMAMAFSVAALATGGTMRLADAACVAVSYPSFFKTLTELGAVTAAKEEA